MTLYIGDKPVGLMKVVEKKVPKVKYGVSIDNLLGDVDENGVYSIYNPNSDDIIEFNFTGVKIISGSYSFAYKCSILPENFILSFPDLEEIQYSGLRLVCYDVGANSGIIKGLNLSKVKSIGDYGLREAFDTYTWDSGYEIGTLYMPLLESIGQYGLYSAFRSCGVKKIVVDSLKTVGSYAFQSAFQMLSVSRTEKISEPIYFYSLTSVEANAFAAGATTRPAFQNQTTIPEIHFRVDMQATIEALTGYANKFGATNAIIYFDLIGTITVGGVAYARNEPSSIRVDTTKTHVAWVDESSNIVYTDATSEPAVGTVVYSDAGTTQVGTVEGVA